MSSLPGVAHFTEVLPQIYRFLLQSCLVETNLSFLQHFLLFLTQHYPDDKLYESAIGLSRLIVDRYDIIQKILCPPLASQTSSDAHSFQRKTSIILLSFMFELFRRAMEVAISSQTVPQVTSSSDFLLVLFPSKSQKALVHTALIQAIYLLLSIGPPLGKPVSDFAYLRDLWAPTHSQDMPEAQTMEDKDPVSLPPKEVLPYTFLSLNSVILEATVAVAQLPQLCEQVLRFGCSRSCMEKILDKLDNVCKERSSSTELRRCIADPVMMARVVEIQMLRGLESGDGFLTFVRGLSNIPDIPLKESSNLLQEKRNSNFVSDFSQETLSAPQTVSNLASQSQLKAVPQKLLTESTEEIEQYLIQIFCQFSEPKKSQNLNQLKTLQNQLEHDLKLLLHHRRDGGTSVNLTGLVAALSKVTSSNKVKVIEGMLQTRFSVTLFRVLTQCMTHRDSRRDPLKDQLRKIVDNVLKFLQSSRYKLTKLRYYHSFMTVLKVASHKLRGEGRTPSEQKDLKVMKDIRKSQNLHQVEPVITKVVQETLQSHNLVKLESMMKYVVRKSISTSAEDECISLLHNLKSEFGDFSSSLAYQSNPELFNWKESLSSGSNGVVVASTSDKPVGIPDMSGFLVDVVEILDSELYATSREVTKRFLFGYSETFHGPLQGKVTNLLLSGQGFLLACLVNNSSWLNLLAALDHILDKNHFKEWYV